MSWSIKHIAVVYLAGIFLLKTLAIPLICLQYVVNQSYITANFCENTLTPQMRCYGKCYLNKQLAKASEAPESRNTQNSAKSITIDFCEDLAAFYCLSMRRGHAVMHAAQPGNYSYLFATGVFHPPAVIS